MIAIQVPQGDIRNAPCFPPDPWQGGWNVRIRYSVAATTIAAAMLAGCATEFSVPLTGQMSNGVAAAGQATARSGGNGSFWVQIPGGSRCSGSYDSTDTNPTIVLPVQCSDGRHGEAVTTRQLDGVSGTAIVRLSDGTTGQFVFGNLRFDQAFGDGGKATTAPTILR